MSKILEYLLQSQIIDQKINELDLRQQIMHLRSWQCRRLMESYDELYQQKKFRLAMEFFIEELYGPNDFTQRDKDIEKVLPLMEKVLSEETLATFETALKLNSLSYQLDLDLVMQLQAIESHVIDPLDDMANLTTEQYAKAYKACDNQPLRQQQLDFIELLAFNLSELARRKSIMFMLKLSRKPAKLAGLSELQRILEVGASAFKKLGEIDDFIQPIISGETDIMQSLFRGENCLPELDPGSE